MSPARVTVLGLAVALAAAGIDLKLLRSFEFLAFPRAWAPEPATGLPPGRWPPAGAVPVPEEERRGPPRPDPTTLIEEIRKGTTTVALALASYVPPPPPPWRVPRAPTPAALGATIVILDGLRHDHSLEMPEVQRLRARGDDARVEVDFPCFSRVGYAGVLTGALPRVHGYFANANIRPCPIPSLLDCARTAGVRTRLFFAHPTNIPLMFPDGFDEVRALDDAGLAALASPGGPHLTVVYGAEPDHASHLHGALSPEAAAARAEADRLVGRVAAAIDLRREALVVTSDHGHIDRGGHGGTEDAVRHVPVVVAGRGASIAGARSIREVPARVAEWLGVPAPPGFGVAAASDSVDRLRLRLLLAFLAVVLLARLLGGREGPRGRDMLAALAAGGAFLGLYALRGFPFSFSVANAAAEVPRLMLEVTGLAALGVALGAALARPGPRYAAAVLRMGGVGLAVTLAIAGPTAATAIDHPRAAYGVHMAASFVLAAGALAPLLARLGRTREEVRA